MNKSHKVIKHFGSASNLARLLQISPQAVHRWKKIPPGRAKQIRDLSYGVIKYEDLLEE